MTPPDLANPVGLAEMPRAPSVSRRGVGHTGLRPEAVRTPPSTRRSGRLPAGDARRHSPLPVGELPYHLAVSVNDADSVKIEHGHTDFEKLDETCAIDVAEQGKQRRSASES